MKIKTLIAVCVMALALSSCKKEPIKGDKGEKGDKGDMGATGATGANGSNGTNGTNGTNGNANVTSVTLNATSWTWNSSQFWRYATWSNVAILDANTVNNGAVMLYQLVGTNSYIQLPVTQNVTSTYQENDWFQYGINTISVYIEHTNLSDPNPPAFTYKLVCIPQMIIKNNPNVNWANYSEVKQLLKLQD